MALSALTDLSGWRAEFPSWLFPSDEPEEDSLSNFLLYAIGALALWSSLWTTGFIPKACLSCLNPRVIVNCLKRVCDMMNQESDLADSQLQHTECQCVECNRMQREASRVIRCPGAPSFRGRGRGRGRGTRRGGGEPRTPPSSKRKKPKQEELCLTSSD